MKVEKSAYLGIRFDWLYSIYVIFASPRSSLRLAGVAQPQRRDAAPSLGHDPDP